jgi:hypothetical protein
MSRAVEAATPGGVEMIVGNEKDVLRHGADPDARGLDKSSHAPLKWARRWNFVVKNGFLKALMSKTWKSKRYDNGWFALAQGKRLHALCARPKPSRSYTLSILAGTAGCEALKPARKVKRIVKTQIPCDRFHRHRCHLEQPTRPFQPALLVIALRRRQHKDQSEQGEV